MTATEIPAPPSYNEAILQRNLSNHGHSIIVNNAHVDNDDIQLLPPSISESGAIKGESAHKDAFPTNEQNDQKDVRKVTVGKVLLIGLLMIVSPWCASKMIRNTNNPNNRTCRRTRGGCGGSCNVDRMERQQERGERRIQRLERRIERKTEKMDKKEAKDKLCDRRRERGERKIQKWENKIEQRQRMINSRCGPSNVRCHGATAAQPRVVKC